MDESLLSPSSTTTARPSGSTPRRANCGSRAAAGCGELRFPPRPCCPHCHSFASAWRRMTGRGRIWSYVVPHPPLLPAYAELPGYNAIVVELADAPRIRLVGNLVSGPDAALNSVSPDRIRIGARVQAVFTEVNGVTVPRWILERA